MAKKWGQKDKKGVTEIFTEKQTSEIAQGLFLNPYGICRKRRRQRFFQA